MQGVAQRNVHAARVPQLLAPNHVDAQ
jgi:hypothetical protein